MLMTIKYEITKFNHEIGSKAVNETIVCDPSKLFVQDLFCSRVLFYVFSKNASPMRVTEPCVFLFSVTETMEAKWLLSLRSAQHLFAQQRNNTHHILSWTVKIKRVFEFLVLCGFSRWIENGAKEKKPLWQRYFSALKQFFYIAMTGFGLNKWLLKVFKNMSNNRRKSDNSFINSFLGKSLFVAFSMGFRILEVKGLDFFTQAAGYHFKFMRTLRELSLTIWSYLTCLTFLTSRDTFSFKMASVHGNRELSKLVQWRFNRRSK